MSTADAEVEMEARIARALLARIDGVNTALITRTDDLKGSLIAVKDEIASAKIWALLLYIAFAGGLFGALARGFGWL